MDDRYPSTDDHQSVHLDYQYPEHLNRWLPLVKWWLLAIPHYVVLLFLDIASFFVVIAAWFAILITGRYPGGMFIKGARSAPRPAGATSPRESATPARRT